jgi:tetratricopeptide (TPR) repeat protein
LLGLAVLGWVSARAAPSDPAADLAAAREAVRDELHDLAARRLEALIPTVATGSGERIEAVLLLAGVYEAQGRFEDMTGLLTRHETEAAGTPREPAWQVARAVADAGAGRVAAALRRISDLEQRFPDGPELARAHRLRGWCLVRLGRLDEALAAFQAFETRYGGGPDAAANRLEWARALLGAGRLDEAAALLETPAPWPEAGPLAEDRRLALAELAAARRDDRRATEWLAGLVESRSAREPTRAAALFLQAEILERQTNAAAALAVLQQGSARLADAALRNEAGLREGLLLLRLGRAEEGMPRVRAFVSANATNDAARGVQLALARALLDRGLAEQAAAEYQHYLEAFNDPAGVIQALRGRGWALFLLGRYGEALDAFRKGRALAASPADQEWFLVKLADSHFANGQYR